LHLFHDWKVIEEQNIDLPCDRGDYYYSTGKYTICIGRTHADMYLRFNVQILKCWKCDKIKHKIVDRDGKDHSRDVQFWVLKETLKLEKKDG